MIFFVPSNLFSLLSYIVSKYESCTVLCLHVLDYKCAWFCRALDLTVLLGGNMAVSQISGCILERLSHGYGCPILKDPANTFEK